MSDCYKDCKDLQNGVCPPMKMFCPRKLAEHDADLLDEILERIKTEIAKAYVAHFSFEDICNLLDKVITEMKAELQKGAE